MNKAVIAALVLLAIVLLAMPPTLGALTENRVRERVADINASGVLSAEVTAFERRWFGSSATVTLGVPAQYAAQPGGLSPAAGNALPQRAVIAVEFAHGPVAVLDGVHLGWSKMVARLDPRVPGITELQEQLAIPYLFEFRGRTGFGGRLQFDADIPPIDFPADEARFLFSGAFLKGSVGNRLAVDANVGSAEFSSPTGTFALRNLQTSMDYEVYSLYAIRGRGDLSIDSITIVDAMRGTTPVFEATNLRADNENTLDEGGALLGGQVTYVADSLRFADSEITSATLGMTIRNINVAALEAYNATIRDLAGTPAASDPSALLAAIAPQIERALAAGPSVTLAPISFRLDGETFEGRIELAANTSRLPPAGTLNLENPLLVLGLLNSDAELRVSKALALRLATLASQMQLASDPATPPDQIEYMAEAQAGLMLVMLTTQGVLIEDNDGYRTAVRFVDGALTLNGNPLPFGLP